MEPATQPASCRVVVENFWCVCASVFVGLQVREHLRNQPTSFNDEPADESTVVFLQMCVSGVGGAIIQKKTQRVSRGGGGGNGGDAPQTYGRKSHCKQ